MGKKVPDPTPPKETSAATTGTNVSTAIANNLMGNVNTFGPNGSTTFRRTGEYTWRDPYTKQEYTVPTFSQYEKLSPMGEAINKQQNLTKFNLSNLARQQSGFLEDYMATPFRYDEGTHEKWAGGLYDKLNAEKTANDNEAMRTQLANSGIRIGSGAYDAAARSQFKRQDDARNQFLLDSYQQGFQNAQATRNQPINEITALMSGSQVSQPTPNPFQFNRIPTTDNASIIANYDQQRIAAAQANQAFASNIFGGLFSLGGAMLSDRRAKKDIEKTGTMVIRGDDGAAHRTGTYRYRYAWEGKDAPKHDGVMAQNIARVKPSAVMTLGNGLKAVDYGKVLEAA